MCRFVPLLCLLSLAAPAIFAQDADFRFASYYGDNMVLQQAPLQANIWGYLNNSQAHDEVMVEFNGKNYTATYIEDSATLRRWMVKLDPIAAGGPHVITATAGENSITLSNVLFGDVWVCSGQSNMQFTVTMGFNSTAELADAENYPDIRVFTIDLEQEISPQLDYPAVREKWSQASATSIGNDKAWTYFSANCWFYGRNMYNSLKYPIGLVAGTLGASAIDTWSSPDALAQCNISTTDLAQQSFGRSNTSLLWNGMIHPILNMTIYGVVWCQGEEDAKEPENYSCSFPAMIDDWRAKWFQGSDMATNEMFPFGFIQLGSKDRTNTTDKGFPEIRWHQTADYGYAPNPRLQNVFMAVSMDLADPNSPWTSVHTRDKQDSGYRLSLSGRAIAYEEEGLYHTGPIAEKAVIIEPGLIAIFYVNIYESQLEIRSFWGFEIACGTESPVWIEATVIEAEKEAIFIKGTCSGDETPTHVRYAWRDDPCVFKECAVYSGNLPSPPFILPLAVGSYDRVKPKPGVL